MTQYFFRTILVVEAFGLLGSAAMAGTYFNSLTSSDFPSSDWSASGQASTTTAAGTTMSMPSGSASFSSWAFNLANVGGAQNGDFSTQVSVSNVEIPSNPSIDQFELHAVFSDGSYFFDSFSNEQTPNDTGFECHVWNGGFHNSIVQPTKSGTMSITRTGSTLSGYINGTLIFSESDSAALVGVSFISQRNSGNDSISSQWNNFSYTAQGAPEPAMVLPLIAGMSLVFLRRVRS